MKKPTLADRIAEKAFKSADVQKSWAVHMQAFGPILDHAFENDHQSRIHLTAALNHLSKRQLSQGLAKLAKLRDACANNADRAALLFFMGMYCELTGDREKMLALYTTVNELGHRFYLPYLKVAKFYLDGHLYTRAEENYRAGIDCFTATGLDDRDKLILGSAYTNLASCLLMTHRYEEAEAALTTSRSLCPNAPGRAAIEAALHAIRGDAAQVEESLEELKSHAPAAWAGVKESTDKILRREDPLFFPMPLEAEALAAFWTWFAGFEPELRACLERQEYQAALTPVARRLLAQFPFLEEPPLLDVGQNDNGYVLILKDLYAVGVRDLWEKLLEATPEEIGARWQFDIVHYEPGN